MDKNIEKKGLECKSHRILMFYLPLIYALETRFLKRSKWGGIVWGTEYLLPVILTLYLIVSTDNYWLDFFLAVIGVYNFYEIGYIQNDCETIKREENPTLRLSHKELAFYEKAKLNIYAIRVIIGIGLSWYYLLNGISWIVLIILWLIIPFYILYNMLRGRVNLYLIFPLTAFRYCMPIFLVTHIYNVEFWHCLIVLFVAYPFLKFIEICSGGKSLPQEKWTLLFMRSYGDRFIFRLKYYSFLIVCTLIIYLFGGKSLPLWYVPLYYFILRLSQLKMTKLDAK